MPKAVIKSTATEGSSSFVKKVVMALFGIALIVVFRIVATNLGKIETQ
jgi:hypothetical protein